LVDLRQLNKCFERIELLNNFTPKQHRIMANEENLRKPWQKGESGNLKGRPKGSKNRSTIAKKWLEVNQRAKNEVTGSIEDLTQEDLITLAQIKKAKDGDVAAYKALLDSAWGSPVQQVEQQQTNYDFTNLSADEIREILKDNGEFEE
jgi:hypothetical protein